MVPRRCLQCTQGTGENLSEGGGDVDGDSSDIKRIIPKSEEYCFLPTADIIWYRDPYFH